MDKRQELYEKLEIILKNYIRKNPNDLFFYGVSKDPSSNELTDIRVAFVDDNSTITAAQLHKIREHSKSELNNQGEE